VEIIRNETARKSTMRPFLDLTKAITNSGSPIPVPCCPASYYFTFHFQEAQFRSWQIEEEPGGTKISRIDTPEIQTESDHGRSG
jgi:hypothetical protein